MAEFWTAVHFSTDLALWGTERTYSSSGVGDERLNASTIGAETHGHSWPQLSHFKQKAPAR
jgi:hypothetical protein